MLLQLRPGNRPFHLFWDIAVTSVGATGCLGLIAIFAAAGMFHVLDAPPVALSATTSTIVALAFLVSGISTAKRYKVSRQKVEALRSGIDADLAAGVAETERHLCTAGLRAIMDEHRERAYFLRLEDGRTLFVGYWNPEVDDNPALITGMPPDLPSYPGREVEIARGPASRILLGVSFQGETVPVVSTFVYRQGMNSPSVDVGEFVSVPWDRIPSVFG